ncbi:NAD(P)-dependent dehydrogenase (short-subunit alcohol dehydrogenase family) [Motilibacter peucedani]|uniref:NAD(P)-dependent dehydrogenase (Short-subunit alcohol dehydrogenase family) n=1 Tax=Motilibacter peucedani TaxID=598650 RepID=A0A420XU49_9ACTN|nr:SDR family NAD(P)-dependent oxidoreductase [Motilibacter peucedani]RKS80287.1 NAD(P)-dependent dehydrogenase (short-subunit alcohol dehydrogenase family) [Motilibacter peucedani]
MPRVLVTGSTQGIGLQTARDLVAAGADVVLHARTPEKAEQAQRDVPGASGVVVGDLSSVDALREVAEQAAEEGAYDAVIHNAGLGASPTRVETADGLSEIFAVNVLAPYVLTALLPPPRRLVLLTSGLQAQGKLRLDDLQWSSRRWHGMQAYSDSKLHDVVLALWFARRWPQVSSNAVDPGWIKTRMGGAGATDELPEGAETQVWLATSDEPAALGSGRYLRRRRELEPNPQALDESLQDALVERLAELSGVQPPT